jgi:hypothetical protein
MPAATLIIKSREVLGDTSFAELVIWELPAPLRGSTHSVKYRLAYVVDGVCVVRYDNEAGKGDHRHIGAREMAYVFESVERLMADFWNDVDNWSDE